MVPILLHVLLFEIANFQCRTSRLRPKDGADVLGVLFSAGFSRCVFT